VAKKNETGLYEAEIDGHLYEFQKWGAEDSLRVLHRIARMCAEPLGMIAGKALSEDKKETIKSLLDLQFDEDIIARAAKSLMTSFDEDTSISVIKKLSSENVHCDGRKISFDIHFQDQLDVLYEVVKAGLEVQYGNFFAALRVRLAAVLPEKKKTISNRGQVTSIGQSGRP